MTSYPNVMRACCAASLLWLPSRPAASAPEEIQVYQDDSVGAGHFGLDLHNSYVVSGAQTADYAGGVAPNHQYRLTPEFYYGLTSNIELGLYVLADRDASGSTAIGGEKVRIKYIAPRPEGRDWYWGVNLEVGRVGARYDQNPWNTELKGIWGWRRGRWDVAVNANVDAALSGRKPPPPSLEITTKVATARRRTSHSAWRRSTRWATAETSAVSVRTSSRSMLCRTSSCAALTSISESDGGSRRLRTTGW